MELVHALTMVLTFVVNYLNTLLIIAQSLKLLVSISIFQIFWLALLFVNVGRSICSLINFWLGFPCVCPFPVGEYVTPSGGFTVPTKNPNIGWLTNGDFYIKAQLQANGGENMCVEIY